MSPRLIGASVQQQSQPMVFGTSNPGASAPRWDICCTPAAPAPLVVPPARRARLADLDAHVHCSIVGTCLTTAELRRLVPRYAPHLDRKEATDLQIHHTAVELSTDGGAVAKELNKALDARHALAIRKFRSADDAAALKRLWQEALASGDVPGAYWALMTHPAVTVELRTLAFGDVHMLSHLVGAANRADIRRLTDLEEQCERLKEHHAAQQARLHALAAQGAHHAAAAADLRQQVTQLTAQVAQLAAPGDAATDLAQLRAAVADRDRQLALHAARCAEAEQRLAAEQARSAALASSRQLAQEMTAAMQRELGALEHAFLQSLDGGAAEHALPRLDGVCVAYVGGRPGATGVLGKMVAAAGGELLVHDGGIEDRRGMLAAMLPRADLVVFPVDFVGHNAMQIAKQTCARHGIACHPIRSASVASFVELMQRLRADVSVAQ